MEGSTVGDDDILLSEFGFEFVGWWEFFFWIIYRVVVGGGWLVGWRERERDVVVERFLYLEDD